MIEDDTWRDPGILLYYDITFICRYFTMKKVLYHSSLSTYSKETLSGRPQTPAAWHRLFGVDDMFHLERWHRGECLLLLLTCRQARLGTQTPTTRHLKVASRGWGGSVTRVTVRSFRFRLGTWFHSPGHLGIFWQWLRAKFMFAMSS